MRNCLAMTSFFLTFVQNKTAQMINFISFGSGSSGNCYCLYTETDCIIIDAGIGVRTLKKHFANYGLSMASIRNILVTHDHADHVKYVGKLSNEYGLKVYTTEKVHKGIDANYCVAKKVYAENRVYINKGEAVKVGSFEVTAFEIPHDSKDNVGYRICCDGHVFCLMTDIGHVTDEIARQISEAEYLVIEANHDEKLLLSGPYPMKLKERIREKDGHLSNESCAKALAENASEKLKHVWLCHLSGQNNSPALARETVESILNSYGRIAYTGFELDVLGRGRPSGIFELVK